MTADRTKKIEREVRATETGSEKQKEWADNIKLEKISEALINTFDPRFSNVISKIMEYVEVMDDVVDANFWINNRNNTWKEICKELTK